MFLGQARLGQRGQRLRSVAGYLKSWYTVVLGHRRLVPEAAVVQTQAFHRNLCCLYKAAVRKPAPKFHMMQHMTADVRFFGNCRKYSTHVDESLNMIFANMAAKASPRAFSLAVFERFVQLKRGRRSPW